MNTQPKSSTHGAATKRRGRPVKPTFESADAASSTEVTKPTKASKAEVAPTKTDHVLNRLRAPKGATVAQLIEATGWQAHSVRGFLSGTVRKKLALPLTSEVGKDGQRRYRIVEKAIVG